MNSYSDTTIIIPTLNEEESIIELIRFIEKNYKGIFIIISDDGSTDGEKEAVISYIKKRDLDRGDVFFLDRSGEKIHGLTASVVDAIKITHTPYFVVMDGDFQHPPEKIKEIAIELREGRADFCIGVRKKVESSWPIDRKLVSTGAQILGKFSLKIRNKPIPTDVLSGFFGGRMVIMKIIVKNNEKKFEKKGYKILYDLLKIINKRYKVTEIPYVFGKRKYGKSKIKSKHMLIFLKSLFR